MGRGIVPGLDSIVIGSEHTAAAAVDQDRANRHFADCRGAFRLGQR